MANDTPTDIWQGRLVRLRAVEPTDWETYAAWNRDTEQARGLDVIPFPQSREAIRRWAEREATQGPDGDAFRFAIEDEAGELVGDLTSHHCDRRTGTFAYGVSIRADRRRRGYAADAIAVALRYYFRELRYQKVTVGVFDFNAPSIRLHEALGFRREGRLRRMAYTDGGFSDLLLFGLTAEEFARSRLASTTG